jgi:TolA-binding protein
LPQPSAAVSATPSASPALAPASRAVRAAPAEREGAAEALFASANAARAAGDSASAAARYARLSQLYPGTRAELVSRVSRGNLWLSRIAQPTRARDAFASYLAAAPDGTLAEEARVGLARALAQLGQREDERQAWLALLHRHPGSLYAARARARLDELDALAEH